MSVVASLKQHLFRWKSDGSGTFRLNQRRIFILPTRAGIVYAITLAAMFTGAINYNLALGHALVFLLTGLGLVGMLHTFRNLFALRITPGRSIPVFAGETAYFPITLRNDRKIPRLGLLLQADGNQEISSMPVALASLLITVSPRLKFFVSLEEIPLMLR